MLDLQAMQRGFTKSKAILIESRVPMPEKDRLARREGIKAKIARLVGIEADRLAIQRESAGYDAEADRLAAEHVEAMATLQSELREIEERRIQTTIDRKPADLADEARRVQLIDTIAEANQSLEDALKANRKKSAGIHNRLMKCLTDADGSTVANEERRLIELGKPELLDEMFVAQLDFESAVSRMRRAQAELNELVGDETMSRRWGLELSVATEARDQAETEMERLRQEIIAE